MSHKDIELVREAFVAAAKRALYAGFEVLELHGAHGTCPVFDSHPFLCILFRLPVIFVQVSSPSC
jgi:hypothetical protein